MGFLQTFLYIVLAIVALAAIVLLIMGKKRGE